MGRLVLTRGVGEAVIIDHRIEVHVAEIRGQKVRLAIAAPKDIPVNRAEVEREVETLWGRVQIGA